MKSIAILLLIMLISGCASVFSTGKEYVGTWLITLENGRLEKLSIYPDNTAVEGGMEWTTYAWDISDGVLIVSYVEKNKKTIISKSYIGKDKNSLKSIRFSGDTVFSRFSAKRISVIPNKYFNLYEIAHTSSKSQVWECVNVGSGGQVYTIVPWEKTTSLTLEACVSQCVPFLQDRRKGEYAKHAKLESCQKYPVKK